MSRSDDAGGDERRDAGGRERHDDATRERETRRQTADRIRRVMTEEGDAVGGNTRTVNQLSAFATQQLDGYEDLRSAARATKEAAIDDLPELVEAVRDAVEDNGGHVYVADDAADANAYVLDVLDGRDAESVVKSKSMTTEEIGVNEAVEAAGVDVHETDLGEFVIQVAEESPSHLIGPAMHRTPDEIAALFNEHFDLEEPLAGDPHELTEFAREYVGDRIREADVGMTGANFVVAETGTIALVTNEGNARKSAVTPDTHVAVAGVEKIVPSLSDLQPFVELIARSGTGQDITSYLSLLTPPVETPTVDFETGATGDAADREFHLVLVDNGRLAMREDPDLRETLYCIRCGACANSCANFQSVGGHAFGGDTYTGGIGTGWEAGVNGADAADFNDLCTGCTRCVNRCPVKIDIPWINTVVRDRINRGRDPGRFDHLVSGLLPDDEPSGLDPQKRLFGNVGRVARVASALAPVSNAVVASRPGRWALRRLFGVDPRRDLPRFRRETLRKWYERRETERGEPHPGSAADREAVLLPDLYTNHVRVERGKAAVRTLEALGVDVRVPDVPVDTGRAPVSQGMVATARDRALAVWEALEPHVEAGRDVVVVEPSDLAMLRRDYEKLLPATAFETLRDASHEVVAYVADVVDEEPELVEVLAGPDDGEALAGSGDGDDAADGDAGGDEAGDGDADATLVYHSHCQQRTLDLAGPTEDLLAAVGYDVTTTDVECCGMAGSFGYKTEYYDLSADVGEHLVDDLPDDTPVVASGTSCVEQIASLDGREPVHPIEVLDSGGSEVTE